MKRMMRFGIKVYLLLLRCYLRPFWDEFSVEMQRVFTARLTTATQKGWVAVVGVLLHEYYGVLVGVVSEQSSKCKERLSMTWVRRGSLLLISSGLLLLAHGSIASYFCDLANPDGGGIANRLACQVVQGSDNLYPMVGYSMLLSGFVLMSWTIFVRLAQR